MEEKSEDKISSGIDRRKFLLGAAAAVPGMALLNGLGIPKAGESAPNSSIASPTSTACPLDESPLLNLMNPSDVAFSSGRIWVSEARGYRVRSTELGTAFAPSDDNFAGSGRDQFNFPMGITALTGTGELVVADTWNHRVTLLDTGGQFWRYVGGWQRRGTPPYAIAKPIPGYEAGLYHAPEGLDAVSCINSDFIAVADSRNHRVQILYQNLEHSWVAEFIIGGLGQKDDNLRLPSGCALFIVNDAEPLPGLAIVDRGHNRSAGGKGRVKIFLPATEGKLAWKVYLYSHDLELGSELDDPRRVIVVDPRQGRLLAVSGVVGKGKNQHGRIGIFNPWSGKLIKTIDLVNPTIQNPLGMAQCPAGCHLAIANNGRYPDRGDPGEDGFIQIVRLGA